MSGTVDPRRTFWSESEVRQIAAEIGCLMPWRCVALSSIECHPTGLTRAQIAEHLRVLFNVPG